jgi:ketosteroid isomerase-like protein
MTTDVPPAIQAFVDTTDAEDPDAFVQAFADDALLVDWSRAFHGHEGAASWDQSDNIGKHTRFELLGVEATDEPGRYLVTLKATGEGFNGTSAVTFRVVGEGADQRIAELIIRPS